MNCRDASLKPETEQETELGFDATMLGSRAQFSFTVYSKVLTNLLLQAGVAPSYGYSNLFENGTTVQFVHRWLAQLLVPCVLLLALRVRRPETTLAGAMALVQLSLGIATILSGVNIAIATAHQAGAVLLLTTLINVHYRATAASDGSRASAVATWA